MAGRGKGGAPPAGRNHQDKWVLGACLAVLVASAMLLTRDLAAQPAPAEASHLIVEAAASSLAFVASVWAASRFRSERRRGHEPTPRREREPDRERRDGPRPNAAAPRQPVAKATNGAPAPVGRVGAGARRPEGRPRLRIVPPPRE